MKLDFLKKGLVNTANFIPNFAYGNVNKNPISIGINVLGRLLALYLYFQFNSSLDIKSIIIAILFPTLYIMYIIATNGIDNVLDLFGLETGSFTDIFSESDEKCIEKRGDGDDPSNPVDKGLCENVIMGLPDSRTTCESIQNGGKKICKYIGSDDIKYRRCSTIEDKLSCNASKLSCQWANWGTTADEAETACETAALKNNTRIGVSIDDCPVTCPYYYNEGGVKQLDVTSIFKVADGSDLGAWDASSAGNEYVFSVLISDAQRIGFTPFGVDSFKNQEVSLAVSEGSQGYTLLIKGKIDGIKVDDMKTGTNERMGLVQGFSNNNNQLNQSTDTKHYYIKLIQCSNFEHRGGSAPEIINPTHNSDSLSPAMKATIQLGISSNTCGRVHDENGRLVDFKSSAGAVFDSQWDPSLMNTDRKVRNKNAGFCKTY